MKDSSIIIYGYVPSLVLSIIAIVLFGLGFAGHVFLLSRYRTWYFIPIAVGTAMEIIGYIFRILSNVKDPYAVAYFVAQYFCIVVAPVLFSASIYTIASTLTNFYGREHAPLSPKLILWGFVGCDVVATLLQVAGAALVGTSYSNGNGNQETYNHILLAGLAFQVFSFAVFLIVFIWILLKARSSPRKVSPAFTASVFVAALAVYLRTCFRLAETAEGLLQNLSSHEVYFGCLEFAPMIVAVYLLMYGHPGRWLSGASMAKPALSPIMSEA
ncbi:RTA1 like protein [Aureobasidium pullulans]|uniref:RTA1 like protein n=1 Tax=Aureobasidium pullulans TaxID=5580 RepID=A0A4S9PSA8_AURPU|nr:RTA1 like protein [Aureobasidium pullulans]THY73307.1 RTA1 like protein [Aureobasidium pullulans]THZ42859.1 RTA1 like protein [Aureobasidium pullulans]THZ54892.1 RTA1 like protein [Aureobasidium pullulans]THZ90545.1 RTA1 like protein [Aureobasidium pullulans]